MYLITFFLDPSFSFQHYYDYDYYNLKYKVYLRTSSPLGQTFFDLLKFLSVIRCIETIILIAVEWETYQLQNLIDPDH